MRNFFFKLAGLLLLAGCAHFEDQPIDPLARLNAFASRSLDDPGLRGLMRDVRPDADFSKGWNEAGLTLAAFYFQPDLAVFRAEWAAASAGIAQAGEWPNPTLSVVPAFNTSSPSDISPWVAGLALDIPIDYSGKRRARQAEARALARSAWLNLAQVAWEIRVKIRAELLAIHAARQRSKLQGKQVKLLRKRMELFEKKQQMGGTDLLVVAAVRQLFAQAQLEQMESQKQEALATARLAAAVGLPIQTLENVPLDFSGFDSAPPALPSTKVWKQALTHRADILGSLAEYAAAQAALQLEIARQYPDLSIGPGYEFDQGDHKWGLGISLTLPLLNRNLGAITVARRRREAAAARFTALQSQVLGQLNSALADYTHSLRQFRAAQEIECQNAKNFQLLEKRAAAGAVARENLITGQLAMNASARQVLDRAIGMQQALGRLEAELQTPSELPSWQAALEKSTTQNEDRP